MRILNNRGDRMRKLIITIVLTAFIVTLSSPILNAAQWDPATGPKWPERAYNEIPAYSGDDSGWGDPQRSTGNSFTNQTIYSSILNKLIRSFYFIIFINNNCNSEEYDSTNNRETTNSDVGRNPCGFDKE